MGRRLMVITAVFLLVTVHATVLGQTDMLTPMELLGKSLFFDKISEPGSMSCADCHAPSVGFTGPIPGINMKGAVYPGAVPQRAGNRKPPSASYATFSPIFHYDEGEGLFVGGNFWDGRATGERLGNPAADQALGPFLNPVEQNNPSKQAVLEKVAASKYTTLWEEVWGEPVSYGTPEEIERDYDRIGLAIGVYEASTEVNPFSSKFDIFWHNAMDAGIDVSAIGMSNWTDYQGLGLTKKETKGLALFNDESKGKCALCHVLEPAEEGIPPLLTDFTFDNLGVPKNPENPFYVMDEVYLDDGTPINPEGMAWIDPGLAGFLETRPEWQHMTAENYGKHKVPSLRNVGKRPNEEFGKAYTHNGFFTSLREIVHFYNTRDVKSWPPPEVPQNVNTDELGDLGLSKTEEGLIVTFMETLSDGYVPEMDKMALTPAGGLSISMAGPNPFNPSTTVRYYLPEPGNIRLHVFNVAGQRVATLVDGWQDAGEYDVQFGARNMASGVYFLRLSSSSATVTTKAVMLR